MSKVGGVNLLTNPMRPMESYSRAADDAMEKETTRKLPYDVGKIVAQYTTHSVVRIKLPVGWVATLPIRRSWMVLLRATSSSFLRRVMS